MSSGFEELAFFRTRLGDISLRRRHDPLLDREVYEVKLNDEFLMSSLFTRAEIELSKLALAQSGDNEIDVLIGGLGLGYTAATALEHKSVRSLDVIEALAEIIDWHQQGMVPLGGKLAADKRCRFIQADFFKLIGINDNTILAGKRYHAILLDIDHSPSHHLHPDHAVFYRPEGLHYLTRHLQTEGVFAMWSNDSPEEEFMQSLRKVFCSAKAHIISFYNPYQDRDATATVYVATMQ